MAQRVDSQPKTLHPPAARNAEHRNTAPRRAEAAPSRPHIPSGLLKEGSHGPEVAALQKQLKQHGFNPGSTDGTFGPGTKRALEAFQRHHGMTADGIARPRVWKHLGGAPLARAQARPESQAKSEGVRSSAPAQVEPAVSGDSAAQREALMRVANAMSGGRRPKGHCLHVVHNMLDRIQYGHAGKIPRFPYAHQFADFLNKGDNAARYGLKKLDIHNPYDAPPGAIVVVRAGTPGTHNPIAGDIAVAMGGGRFLNDGEMNYHGSGRFPPGNTYVLGVYVPA